MAGWKIYIQSVHDDIEYPCLNCDYKATAKMSDATHKVKHGACFKGISALFVCASLNIESYDLLFHRNMEILSELVSPGQILRFSLVIQNHKSCFDSCFFYVIL